MQFLWWEECPSWERALAGLRDQMEELGLDPEAIEMIRVDTDDAAEREGFVGSPTIRVDGADIQPPVDDEPARLACRVYRRRDGRVSPLPDPDDVREALAAAARAG